MLTPSITTQYAHNASVSQTGNFFTSPNKMSSETSKITSEITTAADYGLNHNETALTLGLPGDSRGRKLGVKRRFSETIDLKLSSNEDSEANQSDTECSDATKPPSET